MNKILKDTKKLTFIGVMFGLTLFFTFTLGVIPASFASLAILIFIPTIITSIIHGPLAGGIMGFLAGASTLLRAMVAPAGILDPFFINPLISILPRIFVGIIPYYVYTFLKKISNSESISSFLSGAMGAITNTALVMFMLYILKAKEIVEAAGMNFKAFLIAIITGSAILEAVLTAIFTCAIIFVYKKIKNESN